MGRGSGTSGNGRGRATRARTRRLVFGLLPVLSVSLVCGCVQSPPECGGIEVKRTIADLFRKQFKLTPYVRYIDFDKSQLNVEAVFTVKEDKTSRSCAAFVIYSAQLNEAGQRAENKNDLTYSLLYELQNEKQVYYTVSLSGEGQVRVHIDRVGG